MTSAIPADIVAMAEERQQCRAGRDFARADALRAAMAERGYEVRDVPGGFKDRLPSDRPAPQAGAGAGSARDVARAGVAAAPAGDRHRRGQSGPAVRRRSIASARPRV